MQPMDLQYEQRLRDEVIYLHSLWYQGPPRAAAAAPSPAALHHLQPSQETQFKKKKKTGDRKRKKPTSPPPDAAATESNSSPGPNWTIPSPPPPDSTRGWPSLEAKPDQKPLSSEDQLKLASRHAHYQALKVVQEFFTRNNDDDSDAIDSSSDEDDDLMDKDCGRDEYTFFFKVFKEDSELREYYEKNFAKGEFSCLVCGAIGGKKMGKKYSGCLALVQHSITIAKTKKKRAHRAFAQAVCRVLGWEIDQLPTIVSLLSGKSCEVKGNDSSDNKEGSRTFVNNVDAVDSKKDNTVQESGPVVTGISSNGPEGDMNSLACPDAGKSLEDTGEVHPHEGEEPAAEGLASNSSTCPDVDKDSTVLGMMHPLVVEEPASEGLAINSTCAEADKNLENLGIVSPHNIEEPISEILVTNSQMCLHADENLENRGVVHPHKEEEPEPGLASVPLHENINAGNEMQDLQKATAILTAPNEDTEN